MAESPRPSRPPADPLPDTAPATSRRLAARRNSNMAQRRRDGVVGPTNPEARPISLMRNGLITASSLGEVTAVLDELPQLVIQRLDRVVV